MSDYLIQRSGYYYYFRRVPKDMAAYDTRRHIKVSLKTKDKNTARKRAVIQNEAVEKFWRDLITSSGSLNEQNERYKQIVQTARVHGFAYRDISEIAENTSAAELVDRMLALKHASSRQGDDKTVRNALTGTAEQPEIKLSQLWEIYRPKSADRLIGKTEHQIRKWENPRRLALENFTAAIGDKNILEITRKDILAFHEWWLKRITKEGLKPGSANKNFRHIKDILDRVYTALDLEPTADIETLFAKIKLAGGDDSRRSYEADYVQQVFLNSNALDGLNDEARALIYIMADTGARVSEITGLMAEDIRLDVPIPYIHIRSNSRGGLKTGHSDRQIPLVGAALKGAKMFPQGLSRYASADSISTYINKYFRENDISPSDGQSLYSLRHTFKDRLRDIQAPEEVIDNLMGHKSRGPKYGRGHILETKLEWLEKIAYKAEPVETR
jgi:integrase